MEHRLSAADDGDEVVVAVGDRLVIRLPENGGTGFLWALEVPAGLRVVEDEPEPAPLEAGVGGTGLHRFVLEVVDLPGEGTPLSGVLAQPWEPDQPAESWGVSLRDDYPR